MKKLIILFLAVIALTANSYGQDNCTNTILINKNDTVFNISSDILWLKLTNVNDTLDYYFYTNNNDTTFTFKKITIYTGLCGNLTLIDTITSNTSLFKLIDFISGNNYYLKFEFTSTYNGAFNISVVNSSNKYAQEKLLLCQSACNIIGNPTFDDFSNYSGTLDLVETFAYGQVCRWNMAWGSPNLQFDATNNHNYFARMWGEKVANQPYGEAIIQNGVTLLPNTTYMLSFDYKVPLSTPSQPAVNLNQLRFYYSNYTPSGSGGWGDFVPTSNLGHLIYSSPMLPMNDNWQTTTTTFTTPSASTFFNSLNKLLIFPNQYLSIYTAYIWIDNIVIRPANQLTVNIPQGNQSLCKGSPLSLQCNITGGTPPYQIQWSTGSTTNTTSLIVNNSQTITATVTDALNCTVTASVNIIANDNPIAEAGINKAICLGNSTTLGGNPTASGAPAPFTYNWTDQNGNFISNASNPVVSPTATTTYTVVVTSNGCSASDNITITVNSVQVPTITGNTSNCDLTTTYTVTNPFANSAYNWTITNGTIISGQNTANVNVTWSTSINNNNPGVITVTNTQNGCTASDSIKVYQCCGGDFVVHDVTITSPAQIPNGNFFINGTVTLDCDVTINNRTLQFGSYAKIIVAPGRTFTVDNGSFLQEGCKFMWDGIYVSDPTAEVKVLGNSTVQDAINGIVSDNGGKFTLNNANMNDNLYSVRVHNYFTVYPNPLNPQLPHPGSIKNTRFNGSINLAAPYSGQKSFCGIECDKVYNFTIGSEADVADLNYFQNMRFGIYATNANLYINNNSFSNIQNNYPPVARYENGAIYARYLFSKSNLPTNLYNSIDIGGNNLKRNYFENCKTGVYTFSYLNTIDNNDFKECDNGIRSIEVVHNSVYKNNEIYSDLGNGVTAGYGIDLRNTHSDARGISCLVDNNDITNKRNAISLINISAALRADKLVEVKNNLINYFVNVSPLDPNYVPVPTNAKHIGIWIQNCHYSQTRLNTIIRNYPVLASFGEGENVLGIRIAESRNASVFQNNIMRMGSGIYTNGLLTNTQFDCNIFYYNHYGFQFSMFSSITDQGSPNGYNPNNQWDDYNPQNSRMFDNFGLFAPGFKYYYDPNYGPYYDPTIGGVSGWINPQQNPDATSLCIAQTGPVGPPPENPNADLEAREAAFGQIVRNERYYAYLEEEYRLKDREYVYEMLRNYPELIDLGGEDDNLYLQFYNEAFQSDIETVLQMREEMYEQNLALALEKLAQIADDNTINTNRKIADGIYLDTWANGNFEFSQDQLDALTTLAYLTPYAGGDAVYTARVMLDINPDEIAADYVKGPAHNLPATAKEMSVSVFPNPAKDKLTVKFNETLAADGSIEFYGIMGNLVYTATIGKGNAEKIVDVNGLKAGLYFYTVKLNDNKVKSGKITILNK